MSQVVSSINAEMLMMDLARSFSNGRPLLPTVEFGERDKRQGYSSGKQPDDSTSRRSNFPSESQSGSGAMLSTSGTSNEISNPSDNGRTKEIYLCVDKVLVEVQQTTLCPIPRVNTLSDDKVLLCKIREQLRDCNGWFKNLISWKTCTEVKFVTVSSWVLFAWIGLN